MSRPWPVNTPPPATARAMGMRKRRVEPLSPQSNRGSSPDFGPVMPVTRMVLESSCSHFAPSCSMQERVARMSWEKATLDTTLSPPARAAAIISRWA